MNARARCKLKAPSTRLRRFPILRGVDLPGVKPFQLAGRHHVAIGPVKDIHGFGARDLKKIVAIRIHVVGRDLMW